MYSPHSYGSPPAELSNNPFIDHPANALSRYPDINTVHNATSQSNQYTPWSQQPGSSFAQGADPNMTGYPGQGMSAGYGGGGYQQPQQTGWDPAGAYGQPQPGYSQQTPGRPGFQPTSSFGQQLSAHVNSAYTGAPQQQQPQYTGYPSSSQFGAGYQPAYPQQQQQQQAYLPEFDPYAQNHAQSPYGGSGSASPFGTGMGTASGTGKPPHPREYVQQHKQELESWDAYSWKQVQNSFDALKEAWSQRKRDIEARARTLGGAGLFGSAPSGYGYPPGYNQYGGPQQEAARLEQLAKEAESHFDSVAASAFQLHEVFTGYRQSGDLASRRRVREAINAALVSLPDWPPQSF